MVWEVWRYFAHDWISRYWIDPVFHFTYYGFGWVQPWAGSGMYLHMLALGILAVFIVAGLWYRISTALFFIGFTYMFLLEQARYLNHFYFICLISFLMIFIPAHHAVSIDARQNPTIHSWTAPAWALWILRSQVGVVYFYGGLAKINADWLRGEPMRMWLRKRVDYPMVGHYFKQEWVSYYFSYGGLLLDLLIVPFLLWKRTRLIAFGFAVFFHLTNAAIFRIGIFPWFMLAMTLLFFSPDWPKRCLAFVWMAVRGEQTHTRDITSECPSSILSQLQRIVIMALVGVYMTIQLLFPLRHFLYPGKVSWTEEGHRFSWHMKLRDKESNARFFVSAPTTNEHWTVNPHDELQSWQARKMVSRPDMILQFIHYLVEQKRNEGYENVEVRARVMVSLNGRSPQMLIDSSADLAAQSRTLHSMPWILPLGEQSFAKILPKNEDF